MIDSANGVLSNTRNVRLQRVPRTCRAETARAECRNRPLDFLQCRFRALTAGLRAKYPSPSIDGANLHERPRRAIVSPLRICLLATLGFANAHAGSLPPPDLNRDGMVNFGDVSIMSQAFYTSSPRSDLNVDGTVNFSDLAILKAYFFDLWPVVSPTTLRWLPPTTTETGEPLPPEAITSWQVQIDGGAPTTIPLNDTTTVIVDGVTYTQWKTTVSGRGAWSYCMRAVVGTQASDCSEAAVKRVEP